MKTSNEKAAVPPLTRRRFAIHSSLAIAAALGRPDWLVAQPASAPKPKRRAAIIGHTGHGDYGHSLDVALSGLEGVEVVAVADPDDAGRAKAAQRIPAPRQYADYRQMLEKERPQLVCLAPRWTDQRSAMALAALRAGAHLFTEKPFTATLAEADEILATAGRAGLKIAVAHQMRLAPSIVRLKQSLDEGWIGELVQLRAWGKQDTRAGGEDMLVLGSHLFDLLRYLAGDALWFSARVLQDGRDITRADARIVKEQIGPVAGNEIHAQFAFAKGVNATFTSSARLRATLGPWGIELLGSKGAARILAEVFPTVYVLKAGGWDASGRKDEWTRWDGDPGAKLSAEERGFGPANRRVVENWLAAIEQNREPACSGRAAMKSIEMIMAVYHAALSGARVTLPLKERRHPLAAG
ncbi:MAG TPA: Gfo/Idh/MocA family oxidoreductase [Verrucomicrobiae bacterium]|nr:Gfo/Idh/MocA family oxidoreductase [Verrucomicrobiae bacterium]